MVSSQLLSPLYFIYFGCYGAGRGVMDYWGKNCHTNILGCNCMKLYILYIIYYIQKCVIHYKNCWMEEHDFKVNNVDRLFMFSITHWLCMTAKALSMTSFEH